MNTPGSATWKNTFFLATSPGLDNLLPDFFSLRSFELLWSNILSFVHATIVLVNVFIVFA